MNRLSKAFYVGSCTSALVAGIGLFVWLALGSFSRDPRRLATAGWLCILVGLYVAVVFHVLVYKMWKAIQDGHARTTPGKAVGFLFIPLFNLYWIFQALWGFSKDYNGYVVRHSLRARRLREGLFLAYVVLCLAIFIILWLAFALFAATFASAVAAGTPVVALPGSMGLIVFLFALWGLAIGTCCVGLLMVARICDAVNALTVTSEEMGNCGALYCTSGEFEGNKVALPADGIIIGRNPAKAHLVLSSREVSGEHALVWPDRSGSGIWVRDMQSTHGTYYLDYGISGAKVQWVPVREPKLLQRNSRFRIGEGVAEFEVTTA